MQKNIVFKCYYFAVLIVIILNSFFLVKDNLFFDISDLPKGKFCYSLPSTDNLYKVDVYRVSNSLGTAIRVSATDSTAGTSRNIYWQTEIDDVRLEWHDNGEIVIDDMPINIAQGGFYDCRRGFSIILAGSLNTESAE